MEASPEPGAAPQGTACTQKRTSFLSLLLNEASFPFCLFQGRSGIVAVGAVVAACRQIRQRSAAHVPCLPTYSTCSTCSVRSCDLLGDSAVSKALQGVKNPQLRHQKTSISSPKTAKLLITAGLTQAARLERLNLKNRTVTRVARPARI